LKQGIAKDADVEAAAQSMLQLNREACEAMLAFDVHGCTDVTGFGLIGHSREMALASKVTMEIDARAVQFLPGAVEYARQGAIPGGLKNNREFASSCVEGSSEFDDLLYDPQTSGGLLIALPERDAALLEAQLPTAYRIGRVAEKQSKPIRLL
jgi:selenide, water dikinase